MIERSFNPTVRPPAQAGRFYEADPRRLRQEVERLLRESPATPLDGQPIALMAPHAGYIYSGRVAAAAYQTIKGRPLDRVLILAPSHQGWFNGGALPSQAAFATPLGEVKIDQEAIRELSRHPHFAIDDDVHRLEHSIEVQLPFLQVAAAAPFEIVPIALGRPPGEGLEVLAGALGDLLGARKNAGQLWLIVASTDTYHGYDVEACLENDRRLQELVEALNVEEVIEGTRRQEVMACGWAALALAMRLARQAGARRGLALQRSDSRGESSRAGDYVVGYIAAAFV